MQILSVLWSAQHCFRSFIISFFADLSYIILEVLRSHRDDVISLFSSVIFCRLAAKETVFFCVESWLDRSRPKAGCSSIIFEVDYRNLGGISDERSDQLELELRGHHVSLTRLILSLPFCVNITTGWPSLKLPPQMQQFPTHFNQPRFEKIMNISLYN